MTLFVTAPVLAQPLTHSELGWPHPIPQNGNTNPPPACSVSANPLSLVVLTNSVTSINLLGTGGTFLITKAPTNGTITGLNTSSGAATYTETAANVTNDFFQFTVSNSVSCLTSAPVNIAIVTNLSCGSCYTMNHFGGGIVTGNIYFNVGFPNEEICISYQDQTCSTVTNCTLSDQFGEASFFVHLCPGTSNYCIVAIGFCTNFCYLTQVHISGTLDPSINGDYFIDSIIIDPVSGVSENLTNSSLTSFIYQPSADNIFPVPPCPAFQYPFSCSIVPPSGSLAYGSHSVVFNPDCTSIAGGNTITGWTNICAGVPLPIVTYSNPGSTQICTNICP